MRAKKKFQKKKMGDFYITWESMLHLLISIITSELKTLEWWILRLIFDPLSFKSVSIGCSV